MFLTHNLMLLKFLTLARSKINVKIYWLLKIQPSLLTFKK